MTFDTNRRQSVIETFELVIIETQVQSGTCTLGSDQGWNTPLTCDQIDNNTTTMNHYFATPNYPVKALHDYLGVDTIYPYLERISETPTVLKQGEGLAGRGSARISIQDFEGDPGPIRTSSTGNYIAKLRARNILEGARMRILLGHVVDGAIQLSDFQQRRYIIDRFEFQGDNRWTIRATDVLKVLDDDETVWPPERTNDEKITLSQDLNETDTSFTANFEGAIPSPFNVIRINDEIMRVTGTNTTGGTTTITVATRGSRITSTSGKILTETERDEHENGDEIFVCYLADGQHLAQLLRDILNPVIGLEFIDVADWTAEINLWHPNPNVDAIFAEALPLNEQIGALVASYLFDIFYDPVDNEIKLLALSPWRDSDTIVREGIEIESNTFRFETQPARRVSRASILYNMIDVTGRSSVSNFRNLSLNIDVDAERLYGLKLKQLEPSHIIDEDLANLLTQRYVSRFSRPPIEYNWVTQEQFLNFSTGDVVNIEHPELISFSGQPQPMRAQIVQLTPVYNTREGRSYRVRASSYGAPMASDGGGGSIDDPLIIRLGGDFLNLNLFIRAGAPPQPIFVRFIFNGGSIGSNSILDPAVEAGPFSTGSNIEIILTNGTLWSAKGGNGGDGSATIDFGEPGAPPADIPGTDGTKGGLCYDANGINTQIRLIGSFGGETANGELRAPGGGAGGGGSVSQPGDGNSSVGGAGGGGRGIEGGNGGQAPIDAGPNPNSDGQPGSSTAGGLGGQGSSGDGTADGGRGGNGGDWGTDGEDGAFSGNAGGEAGSSLRKSGATVTISGSANYTQGSGDIPDTLQP